MSDATRLLLVIPEASLAAVTDLFCTHASIGWDKIVHIMPCPVKLEGRGLMLGEVSELILETAWRIGATQVLIAKDIRCSQKVLDKSEGLSIERASVSLIKTKLPERVVALGLCWISRVKKCLDYYSRKEDPYQWLKQFEELGFRWVGEGILRQFDVIPPGELGEAFRLPIQEKIGADHTFAVALEEDDLASSGHTVGGACVMSHGSETVVPILAALRDAPPGNRIVICEDGLWTGTELQKLLSEFARGGRFEKAARSRHISLRFCAVSDYGLLVCRNLLRSYDLEDIDVSFPPHQRFFRLLPEHIRQEAIQKMCLCPKEFQNWLVEFVEPLAFRDDSRLWVGRQREAQNICEELGRQLIDRYSIAYQKTWEADVKARFALGASRFASTVGFPNSTPKVCLPVLWLGGLVEYGGVKVDWKPLAYDARRVGKLIGE